MPKLRKVSQLKTFRRTPLHIDLDNDLNPSKGVKPPRLDSKRRNENDDDEDDGLCDTVLDATTSAKILKVAEEQEKEDISDDEREGIRRESSIDFKTDADNYANIQNEWVAMELENQEMDKFIIRSGVSVGEGLEEQRTLADLIMAKIQEKESKKIGSGQEKKDSGLSPKVIQVYTEIGNYLAKYKSGKIPKAFKIIPRLSNWEEILYLTNPIDWTPNAMHEATRIFASNLNPRMAQRFYNLVVIPAVREDIATNKKLNFHYYEALKKAMFKPSAWIKGILLPLLLEGCTLKEAIIFGSILSKVSIPPIHVAAALIRICDLHSGNPLMWSASTSYIIGIMLNKKCALPKSAIDAILRHFASFITDSRELPVVWHRSLLILVQRYKFDFKPQHLATLTAILKVHCHRLIGPEIRREIQHGEVLKWVSPSNNNDTTMVMN